MSNRYLRSLALVMGFVLIFWGTALAAKIKVEIDPATGKPVVRSDVPVVSTTTSPTGWTVVTLSTGERVGYFVDPAGAVAVQVFSGAVNVVAGNTTARMEAGEAAAIKINKATGAVQIAAQKGVITVSAQGRRVKIKPGQQTVVHRDTPPSPPTPAPSMAMRTPPAVPHAPAVPSAPTPPPTPPEYQVNPNVEPPPIAKGMDVEEYHGLPPASPAE